MKYPVTNLNLYKSFLAAYETQNMSRAADLLGTTQPNITHNIKELERQLNIKLFFSSPRGVRPTKEADILFSKIASAFGSIVNAEDSVKKFDEQSFGCVRIGCPSHIAGSVLVDLIKQFRGKYKNISLDIYSESVESLIDMLKRQEIDVLILTSQSVQCLGADYQKTEIKKLEYEFCAAPSLLKKHGLSTTLTLNQVRSLPIIVHRISARYQEIVNQNYLKSEQMIHTSTVELALRLVAEGLGIGCYLKDFLAITDTNNQIVPIQVEGLKPSARTLTCVYDKTITDKVALSFIRELEKFAK